MKVITGGQLGTDIGATRAAFDSKLHTGGFIPLGGRQENGALKVNEILKYKFCEVASYDYAERTRLNVGIADAVLIISDNLKSPGTVLTRKLASAAGVPCLVVDDSWMIPVAKISEWLEIVKPSVLMVAGNRESKSKGIEQRVYDALCQVWRRG